MQATGRFQGHRSFPGITAALVCRRWRDVALACPQLWNSIFIEIDRDSLRFKDIVEATEICLVRSGQAPLDLLLSISSPLQDEDVVQVLFQKLVQHSHRWKQLYLRCDSINSVPYVSHLLANGTFTNLESLKLRCFSGLPNDSINPSVFSTSPKLQELILYQSLPENLVGFPWGQIRTLNLDHHPSPNVGDALLLCSSLEHLFYEASHHIYQPASPHRLVTVKSFTLTAGWSSAGYQSVQSILDGLDLPSATTICLQNKSPAKYNDSKWPNNAFIAFITRSACSITKLTLVDIPLDSSDLCSIFELTPTLTDLTFKQTLSSGRKRKFHADMDFIRALHSSYSDTPLRTHPLPLLPKLTCLTLHVSSEWFDTAVFVDVVQSRWVPDHAYIGIECLRSVEIFLIDAKVDFEGTYGSVRDLQKEGLKMYVRRQASYVVFSKSPFFRHWGFHTSV